MKKISCMVLALVLTAACLAGCGPKMAANTESDIELVYWSSGSGVEFLERTIDDFEEAYPQYNVYMTENYDQTAIANTFGLGADYDTVDLYMYSAKAVPAEDLEEYGEPLGDILGYTVPGESKSIGQKFYTDVLECLEHSDGEYYNLPYQGGWLGLVYNKSIITGEGDFIVPNTTTELEGVVMALDAQGTKAFQHFEYGGYWRFLYSIWQAQYDGMDYINNTFNPLDDGVNEGPSKEVLTREDGRLKAMEVLERIVTPNTVTIDSNSEKFTTAQTKFLNNSAAMMVNGSWLMNEMRTSSSKANNFLMMRTPVISSIVENCDSIQGEGGGTPDRELSALIDDIDAVSDGEKTITLTGDDTATVTGEGYSVTEKDYKRVQEARNIMASTMAENSFIVPNYSNAKAAVKEFIKFYYSDANLLNVIATNKQPIPLNLDDATKLDQSSWTEWEVQQYAWAKTAIPWFEESPTRSILFTKGGASPYGSVDIITSMCNTNVTKSAATLWGEIVAEFNRDWDKYVLNAQ